MLARTLAVILGLAVFPAYAGSFQSQCRDIQTCASAVSALLDQKYVSEPDVKGTINTTPNVELTKENAELLFTNMLYLNGYTRVPLGQPDSYQIVRQRDAKDSSIPVVKADQRRAPEIPNVWDLYTLSYRATNPDSVAAMSRILRNLMPPNTRIIAIEHASMLLVTDFAPHLKRMYELIRDLDQKPSAEMRKKWEQDERRYHDAGALESSAPQPRKN